MKSNTLCPDEQFQLADESIECIRRKAPDSLSRETVSTPNGDITMDFHDGKLAHIWVPGVSIQLRPRYLKQLIKLLRKPVFGHCIIKILETWEIGD